MHGTELTTKSPIVVDCRNSEGSVIHIWMGFLPAELSARVDRYWADDTRVGFGHTRGTMTFASWRNRRGRSLRFFNQCSCWDSN